jgi:hypothetical protein
MMSSDIDEDVVLTDKEVFDAAVHAAWEAEGYVTASGEKDKAKLADALYAEVHNAVVKSRPERPAKAITRGTLVASVFPTMPGPDDWVNEPDPDLAEEVFKTISATVWDMLGTDRSKPVQRLLGERTSPRVVLCRYKLGSDRIDAVYVTRSKECVREDLLGAYGAKLRRASAQMSAVTEMAIERVPEHGKAFARVFDEHSKGALEAGNSALKLALLTTNGGNGDVVEEPYPADSDDE